jgi:hypothetical protein
MKIKPFALTYLLLITITFAQTVKWSHSYNNGIEAFGRDVGHNLFETDDNGFLIIGTTDWREYSPWILHAQFLLIKTDEYGNEIDKNMYCDLIRMAIAKDYIGDTIVISAANIFFFTNREGDSLDCITIPRYPNESSFTYDIVNDGSFLLVRGLLPDSGSALLFYKYSRSGDLIWRREHYIFGEDYDDEVCPHLIKRKSDGNFLVAGSTIWEHRYWILEIDTSGDIVWSINPEMSTSSILESSPGSFLCLGIKALDICVIKIIDGGDIEWSRSWIFDPSDMSWTGAFSLISTYDGNFVFCGYTGHIYGTDHLPDGYIMKIDSLANVIWQQRVDIYGRSDVFYSVIQTRDSNFVCTGYTSLCTDPDSAECESLEVCLVKISNDGDIIWEISHHLPKSLTLTAHPNPFNSAVTIALGGVGDGSPVPFDVEIYDVNGRMVDRGTVGAYCIRPFDGSTRLTPTTQEYIWQPHESLPSGVYLVRARVGGRGDLAPTAGDGAATKRIVYLK